MITDKEEVYMEWLNETNNNPITMKSPNRWCLIRTCVKFYNHCGPYLCVSNVCKSHH